MNLCNYVRRPSNSTDDQYGHKASFIYDIFFFRLIRRVYSSDVYDLSLRAIMIKVMVQCCGHL
uniref:Uncharacterized protein n=1 Tax=Daphnia magna TaxID=35525 RepID=A0A0P6JY26_9CRUS